MDKVEPTEEELTKKYLSGEISFEAYSNHWITLNDDDSDTEEKNIEDAVVSPSPSSSSNVREPKKEIKKRNINYTRLSPALLGLMGEANLRFVKGEKDIAEKICYEIIRQAPNSPEPYRTLSQIYEGNLDMAHKFNLLAAHLSNTDPEEWERLAAISQQKKDYKQAVSCYTQVIRTNPQCLSHHLKRLEMLDEAAKADAPVGFLNKQKCYFKLVKSMPNDMCDVIMEYTRKAVEIYSSSNEAERALTVLNIAYNKCPQAFNHSDLNIYLELLISKEQYNECLQIFVGNTGVEIEAEISTYNVDDKLVEQTHFISCHIPDDVPLDLKTKLLICFIHLKSFNIVCEHLETLLNNDVENNGDLFIDLEESLTAVGQHKLALKILEILKKSKNFNLPGVWLKYAECLNKVGQDEESIEVYKKVVKCVPQHSKARKDLVDILRARNKEEEILVALEQDFSHPINGKLLYQQFCLLKKYNKVDDYLKVGEALLAQSFFQCRTEEEFKLVRLTKQPPKSLNRESDEQMIKFEENSTVSLDTETEWIIFQDLIEMAHKLKKYDVMQRLSFGSFGSKKLASYRNEITFLCFQSCLLNDDQENAYLILRDWIFKGYQYKYPMFLNLITLWSHMSQDLRLEKVLYRTVTRNEKALSYYNVIGANIRLATGSTNMALKELITHYARKEEPLVTFLIGVTMVQLVHKKLMHKRYKYFLQCIAFLTKYKNIRCCDQEAYFNFGRACQHLSMNNMAIHYYEKALNCTPYVCSNKHDHNLEREIAFNLYILYKKHAPNLALMYLEKYIIIE